MLKSIFLIAFIVVSAPALASEQTVYTPEDINCSTQNDVYYCVTKRYRNPITGTVKSYDSANKLKKEEHYLEGKLNGNQKYYEAGKLAEERNYKKGKLYGTSKGYYPSGKLKYRANFKGNVHNGYIETFDVKGKPLDRIYRSNGKQKIMPAQRYER